MKKSYNSPILSVHGSIEMLTAKTFGKNDGVVLTIPGVPGNIPIGS